MQTPFRQIYLVAVKIKPHSLRPGAKQTHGTVMDLFIAQDATRSVFLKMGAIVTHCRGPSFKLARWISPTRSDPISGVLGREFPGENRDQLHIFHRISRPHDEERNDVILTLDNVSRFAHLDWP